MSRGATEVIQLVVALQDASSEQLERVNNAVADLAGEWDALKISARQPADFQVSVDSLPESLPERFRSIAAVASNAFIESFEANWRSRGELWRALGVGAGEAMTAGLRQQMMRWLNSDDLEQALTQRFGQLFGSVVNASLPVLGSLFSVGLGSIFSTFSGPSNEDIFADAGRRGALLFGAAWSAEAERAFQEWAMKLPTKTGKANAGAIFHPDVILEVLKNLDSFGASVQDKFADIFEDDVKPTLMLGLGLSEAEAAELMGPLFQALINGAAEAGEAITPELQRMIDWAEKLGVAIEDPFKAAMAAVQEEIESTKQEIIGLTRDIAAAEAGITGDIISKRELRRRMKELGRELDPAISRAISERSGARDVVTGAEFREILELAKKRGADKEQILLLEQMVETVNDRALQNMQLDAAQKSAEDLRANRRQLEKHLPDLEEQLKALQRRWDEFGKNPIDRLGDRLLPGLGKIEDAIRGLPKFASGGAITRDQLAVLHAGEVVLSKAAVGNMAAMSGGMMMPGAARPGRVHITSEIVGGNRIVVKADAGAGAQQVSEFGVDLYRDDTARRQRLVQRLERT